MHSKKAIMRENYYEVLKLILSDYNMELFGRGLEDKTGISQRTLSDNLLELEKQHILKSKVMGNMKLFSLNTENTEIKDILAMAEHQRKIDFLSKHRKLAYLFKDDSRIVGIFGSYASGKEANDSDLDMFIVGEKRAKDYDKLSLDLNLDISIKYFSETEWAKLLKEKNPLTLEIMNNHILIFGIGQFISNSWRNLYAYP